MQIHPTSYKFSLTRKIAIICVYITYMYKMRTTFKELAPLFVLLALALCTTCHCHQRRALTLGMTETVIHTSLESCTANDGPRVNIRICAKVLGRPGSKSAIPSMTGTKTHINTAYSVYTHVRNFGSKFCHQNTQP